MNNLMSVLAVVMVSLVNGEKASDVVLESELAAQVNGDGQSETLELSDDEVDAHRRWLLDLAYQAASSMPRVPHIKDRSRSQAEVVRAAIELGLLKTSIEWIDGIDNWRAADSLAELAQHLIASGDFIQAKQVIARTTERLAEVDFHDEQAWRGNQVRQRLNELNQELAVQRSRHIGHQDQPVAEPDAQLSDEEFDEAFLALQKVVSTGEFQVAQEGLGELARLLDRNWSSVTRRAKLETSIRDSWKVLPVQGRVELLSQLVTIAVKRGDVALARGFVGDVYALINSASWLPEDWVALMATASRLSFRIGQKPEAQAHLQTALNHFEDNKKRIYDVFRPAALCAVGEAYAEIGEEELALITFSSALTEGIINPNSRPRAEAVTMICLAMVRSEVTRDKQLESRMSDVVNGLNDPW